jgi:hypothetical protein
MVVQRGCKLSFGLKQSKSSNYNVMLPSRQATNIPKGFHGCSYYKVVTAFAEAWCGVQVMVV